MRFRQNECNNNDSGVLLSPVGPHGTLLLPIFSGGERWILQHVA